MKKVILLCNDGCTSRLVAQTLAQEGSLAAILMTAPVRIKEKLMRRARKVGFWVVASQVACAVTALALYRLRDGEARRQSILASIGVKDAWPDHVQRILLPDVNSQRTIDAIKELSPDLIVVNGTNILKEPVLNCTRAPFINTHCGITPAYRGVHGGFWAIWENRPDLVGVTLHYLDKGVDSGPVIAQALTGWDAGKDGFLTMPLLQYQSSLPLLRRFIRSETMPAPPSFTGASKQWFYPGLFAYLSLIFTQKMRY